MVYETASCRPVEVIGCSGSSIDWKLGETRSRVESRSRADIDTRVVSGDPAGPADDAPEICGNHVSVVVI